MPAIADAVEGGDAVVTAHHCLSIDAAGVRAQSRERLDDCFDDAGDGFGTEGGNAGGHNRDPSGKILAQFIVQRADARSLAVHDGPLDHGLKTATSYATTVAGTAAQIADYLEERFEGSGSRGGFMLRHSQAEQIEALHNIVELLVPELQRRARFRKAYTGRTLRENLAT